MQFKMKLKTTLRIPQKKKKKKTTLRKPQMFKFQQ